MATEPELKMELVEWRDANFEFDPNLNSDWEADADYINATIGWTKETELWLLVVSEITPGGERSVTRIPKDNVVSRKRLEIIENDTKRRPYPSNPPGLN